MIYKDTASGFISFGGNVVGIFIFLLGWGIFFLSGIRENKAGFSCWDLGDLSWIWGGILAVGRGKA